MLHDGRKDAPVDGMNATTAETAASLGSRRGARARGGGARPEERSNRHDFLDGCLLRTSGRRRRRDRARAAGGASMREGALLIVVAGDRVAGVCVPCGLYASEDLRTWASGITETPKLALGVLTVSWLVYGTIELLGLSHPAVAALVAATVTVSPLHSPAPASGPGRHRATQLREQTLIIGSGEVARRVTQRLRAHDEVGSTSSATSTTRPTRSAASGCGASGCSTTSSASSQRSRRPRDHRLLARRPRRASAVHPRLPRHRRDGGHRAAPLRLPPRGARARPGRRHAVALDRPRAARAHLARRQARARHRRRHRDADRARPAAGRLALWIKLDSRGPVLFAQ